MGILAATGLPGARARAQNLAKFFSFFT